MVFYSCEKCGKQFSQKGHYNKHINKKLPCVNETKLKEIISVVVNEKLKELKEINKKEKIYLDLEKTTNAENLSITTKNNLGQYFTTNLELKDTVYKFILNEPDNILEPSIGQGDLISHIMEKNPNIIFDMYEIDNKIKMLKNIDRNKIIFGDFMEQIIDKLYKTIVYIKLKRIK